MIVSITLCAWKGHPGFERRKSLDVLYCCGEDGAHAWTCTRCGAKVLLDVGVDPNKLDAETIKRLIKEAKEDSGVLIGGSD